MAFKLNSVVPWGRNLNEYRLMFQLSDSDMSKKLPDLVMALQVSTMKQHSKDIQLLHLILYIVFLKKIYKIVLKKYVLLLWSK